MRLRIGTRGSALARTQSGTIAAHLEAAGHATELVIIKTAGDKSDAPLFGSIGAQGVFVREIEQALAAGHVDLAVHSCKDLPTRSPEALEIAAVPPRADPADLLLAAPDALEPSGGWLPLRRGARVGTASARRRAWLRHFRPDLDVQPLRGNVPTRIRRLTEGRFDAIVLAAAGVERLRADGQLAAELDGVTVLRLDPARFVPAPAQGALAVQCRRDDAAVRAALAPLDDAPSRAAVMAERAALARAEGGCDVAFGAYCTATGDDFELRAMLERAGRVLTATVRGADPQSLGDSVWELLAAEPAALGAAPGREAPPGMESLAGRRILLTRSREDCAAWAGELERHGATPVVLPCITTETIDTPELRRALAAAVADADWLIVTSRRGAAAAAALLGSVPPPATLRIAAVGRATATAAAEHFGRVDVTGAGTAADLARALVRDAGVGAGQRVLLAVAENAGNVLERELGAAGAACTRLAVYRTVPAPRAEPKQSLGSLGVDAVVLASPSAVTGLLNQAAMDAPVAIVTIGPTTSAAVRERGLAIAAEAEEPSLAALLEAMRCAI